MNEALPEILGKQGINVVYFSGTQGLKKKGREQGNNGNFGEQGI